MTTVHDPNCLLGIPGCFWRVNGPDGRAVARADGHTDGNWYVTRRGLSARVRFPTEATAVSALTSNAVMVALGGYDG